MVKMHPQLPKMNYQNVLTNIGHDLQTPWSRFKSQMAVLVKMVILTHLAVVGYVNPSPSDFPLNVFGVPFRLIEIHFDHCKNKI